MEIVNSLPDENIDTLPKVEEVTSFTEWEKEPTVADLKQDVLDAQSDTDAHKAQVGVWLDNLNVTGKAKPKQRTGRSGVQPKVIRKQAEWRYASLSEPFLSTPDMFIIKPKTFEDAGAAEQNALVLNNQFATKIGKVKFIDEYIRTMVDEGTVVCKTTWEYEDEPTVVEEPTFEYERVQDMQLIEQLQQMIMLKDENPYQFSLLDEGMQESVRVSIEEQAPIMAIVTGYEEVEDINIIKNQPAVEICDYRNLTIDPSCEGVLKNAMFIEHSFTTSKAELRAAGKYQNIDMILTESNNPLADDDHSTKDLGSFSFQDDARKKIVAHEYWGYRDVEGEGTLTPIVATWVGDVMIQLEENPFPDKKLPFTSAQYLPVRKSNFGEPDAELLEDNQKIIGAVTRGMIDIMARGANGQQATRKDALDITNKRKFDRGEDYEFNAHIDPRQAFHMHTFDEIPNSAQIMLQMQNADAESLTGVIPFSSKTASAMGSTAQGIRSAMDATAQRELGILRRAAEGIMDIGRKIIAMNAVFLEEEEVVRVTNTKFVPIRRDDLAGEFDLEMDISTADADNQKAEELAFMLQTTSQSMGPDFTRVILAKIAKLRKMPELSKQIEEFQPEPDPLQQQIQQLEIQKLQAEIAKIQSETNENHAEAMLDQAKAGTEQAKARNLSSDSDLKDLDYVETESGLKQHRELQKTTAQANANIDLEHEKAKLDPSSPFTGSNYPTGTPSEQGDATVSNGLDQV